MTKPKLMIVFKSKNRLSVGEKTLKRDVNEFYQSLCILFQTLSEKGLEETWKNSPKIIRQGNLLLRLEDLDYIVLTDEDNE